MLTMSAQQQPEGQMEGEQEYNHNNQHILDYEFEDSENDQLFDTDDEECSWWSGDEILNSDYDGQDIIPLPMDPNADDIDRYNKEEQKEGVISVPCLDPQATDIDNTNKQLTSEKSKPSEKSWVCEHCHAINSYVAENSCAFLLGCFLLSFYFECSIFHFPSFCLVYTYIL